MLSINALTQIEDTGNVMRIIESFYRDGAVLVVAKQMKDKTWTVAAAFNAAAGHKVAADAMQHPAHYWEKDCLFCRRR